MASFKHTVSGLMRDDLLEQFTDQAHRSLPGILSHDVSLPDHKTVHCIFQFTSRCSRFKIKHPFRCVYPEEIPDCSPYLSENSVDERAQTEPREKRRITLRNTMTGKISFPGSCRSTAEEDRGRIISLT